MDIDLIFRIAAIGILVSVLNQVLSRSGREQCLYFIPPKSCRRHDESQDAGQG